MEFIKFLKKYYWIYKRANFRGFYYSLKFKNIKFPLIIRKDGKFRNLKFIKTDPNIIIHENVDIFISRVESKEPKLILGSFVTIGRYSSIGCSTKITLGNHVRIAPYVHITDRNHDYRNINLPIWQQPILSAPVFIDDETWIGYGVQIMPGVKIGKHCIIGAGSVVTNDIPDYSVAVGIPARVVKQYDFNEKKWIKV